MKNPAMALAMQLLQRYANDCSGATARLPRATTLREVRDWGDVRASSLVRPFTHTVPEERHLKHAQERQAKALVDGHLAQLQKLADAGDADGFKALMGRLRQNEWVFLRGDHPRLLQQIDRDLAKMRHGMADEPAAPPAPERPQGG